MGGRCLEPARVVGPPFSSPIEEVQILVPHPLHTPVGAAIPFYMVPLAHQPRLFKVPSPVPILDGVF